MATLGSRDSSLCPVPLRLAQNGMFFMSATWEKLPRVVHLAVSAL